MSSRPRVLYAGITNNLVRRVVEHKEKRFEGFSAQYNVDRLVYFESTPDVTAAIAREKQVNGWSGAKKETLIGPMNPKWDDLSLQWLHAEGPLKPIFRQRDSSPRLHRGSE
jgi:putative endonuclease